MTSDGSHEQQPVLRVLLRQILFMRDLFAVYCRRILLRYELLARGKFQRFSRRNNSLCALSFPHLLVFPRVAASVHPGVLMFLAFLAALCVTLH